MKNLKLAALLFGVLFLTQSTFAQRGKITDAQLSLQAGKVLEAKKSIDEALLDTEVQKRVDAWNTKGDVYKQIYEGKALYAQAPNCLFDARDAYMKAYELELNPKKQKNIYPNLELLYSYLFNVGVERYNDKKFPEAFKHFKASAEIDEFLVSKAYKKTLDTTNVFNACIAGTNAKLYDETLPLLQKLANMDYDNEAVYELMAMIYDSKKQTDELSKIVTKGLAKYPNNNNLQIYDINSALSSGDAQKSIDKLVEASKKDPKNLSILMNLGEQYEKTGQVDKAKECYEKAIAADPNYSDAYYNIGAALIKDDGELVKKLNAEEDMTKYAALKKQRDEMFEKALPYFEKAYNIDSKNPDFKQTLKKVYAITNKLDKIKELGE